MSEKCGRPYPTPVMAAVHRPRYTNRSASRDADERPCKSVGVYRLMASSIASYMGCMYTCGGRGLGFREGGVGGEERARQYTVP